MRVLRLCVLGQVFGVGVTAWQGLEKYLQHLNISPAVCGGGCVGVCPSHTLACAAIKNNK